MRIYGRVIQAFRPSSESKLLKYLAESIGLRKGMKILDAGCGVGGPAIWFASRKKISVEGLTISGKQVDMANQEITRRKLNDRVVVRKGDFHLISDNYMQNDFDGAIFLESLGHADNPEKVIDSASKVVRPGGFIYIKDFFKKESADQEFQHKVNVVIDRMNKHYCYNTLSLLPVLTALRKNDFEIDFIKRFDFNDDTSIRARFEEDQGIDIFEGFEGFWPAEWLEIRCVKKI